MFELAQSVWPRFGGDQANRSRVPVPGPHTTPRWHTISLANAHENSKHQQSSVIVMPDESLRVCSMGVLSAVKLDGTILWQLDLSPFVRKDVVITSLFTALSSGETLHFLVNAVLIVDARGNPSRYAALPTYDDSCSPNLTYSGLPLTVSMRGQVSVLQGTVWQPVRTDFGLDTPTPAVYNDNTLAIAGYYGTGLCRVSLDGQIYWRSSLLQADLLPTINHAQIVAGGSLNDHLSAFFAPDGKQMGEYPHAAIFAEYVDGGWIALSEQRLARLTENGKERWSIAVNTLQYSSFDAKQPIVDRDGYIFVQQGGSLLCCDEQGHKAFEVPLPEVSKLCPISIVAHGTLAYVDQNELFLGYA
ncbi:PQQ-binding-like beta-propeller repeat protein [Tengunoibacter tsumagoiensis]|uniref:Outer membrane protein assembly factor BamB n=1 Tax=Tengunoibacter tsumagoiensis TaxID=2014871 RepID=A0A402A9G4_9CHLR|nr:PQQ-binding-like beta-propeller repeat protein [Tengunoibacter tsumagoiensis]GCE15802.1 hypothetical protein KTT_56610 [Tengunoibacter tsumagoiensis]